ncbi:trichohyalin-like isoform X2 [Sardina pilchardus]
MDESVRALVCQREELEKRLNSKKMEDNEHQEGMFSKRTDSVNKKNNTNQLEEMMKEFNQIKEHMTKQEREREMLRQYMASEVENRKRQVQYLEKELQGKNSQLQDLRTQLQEHEKELEERNKQLEKKDKQLEEINVKLKEMDVKVRGNHLLPPAVTGWRSEPVSLCAGILDQGHIWKSWSMVEPLSFGGESPGPAPRVSRTAVSELRLVLLGGSAAGKRAAGNTILGTHTLTHTSTETQHSESRQGQVAGRRVTVVDTTDWFCSGLSEKDMRQEVGLCVRLSAPGPHAFLLVIPVESSEEEEKRILEKMEDIFGESCWGHTLILFTHAEGLRERSVEELLQTGSQELQQLVEKCGNRCHLLNVKDTPDDTQITQLLEKIEEMVSGNRERFYSRVIYQEAEKQLKEIEKRMQKEQEVEERELIEERQKRKELDERIQSLRKMEGEIQQHKVEMRKIDLRATELERKMTDENNEENKGEVERKLKHEISLREEMEIKLNSLTEKWEKDRQEMKDRHKEEIEELRERYEREASTEAEINLMKIILTAWQRHNRIIQLKMEAEFNRLKEQSTDVIVLWELRERVATLEKRSHREENEQKRTNEVDILLQEQKREMERMKQILEEKDREMERMRLKPRRERSLTENEQLKQITVKMNREVEKLRQDVNNLSHTQSLLSEVCESD